MTSLKEIVILAFMSSFLSGVMTNITPATAISSPCAAFKQEAENHPERRYHDFNGNCYLFIPDLQRLRWARDNERSRGHCQGLGGDLVAVETSAENAFIVRTLEQD